MPSAICLGVLRIGYALWLRADNCSAFCISSVCGDPGDGQRRESYNGVKRLDLQQAVDGGGRGWQSVGDGNILWVSDGAKGNGFSSVCGRNGEMAAKMANCGTRKHSLNLLRPAQLGSSRMFLIHDICSFRRGHMQNILSS